MMREAIDGVGMSADEHYKEHYQRPAEGPAHDSPSLLAAKRMESAAASSLWAQVAIAKGS